MLIEINYIVTRKEGRRTVRDLRRECVSVGKEYMNAERVTSDGRDLILQLLELRYKLSCGGTVSDLKVGLNPEVAREMRLQRMELECYEHLKRENIVSPLVRKLEMEYRQKHGLHYMEPLNFKARREIELDFKNAKLAEVLAEKERSAK